MRKEEYINEVISKIENKKARREVEKELSAHIDDRISYYTDAGWDEETANEKAMEHMGETEKVAEEMGKLHDKRYIKRKIRLAVELLILSGLLFFFFDSFVNTDNPVDAMHFIYVDQPISAAFLIHILISNYVFFMTKQGSKKQRVLIIVKRVLCLSLVFFVLLGRAFGLFNCGKVEQYKKQLNEPITQLCSSENDISNMMAYEDDFLCFDFGCIRYLKKYDFNGSYANKNVTFINNVPNWYVKRYSKKEIYYMSRGTKFYNHSTEVKSVDKGNVHFIYTVDDDLCNMELIAYNKHKCVKISVGGPQGSDLIVDENRIIEYAYDFFDKQ